MNRLGFAVIAALAGGLVLGSKAVANGDDGGWTITGPGTTSVGEGAGCSRLLTYAYDRLSPPWEDEQTWTMTKESDTTGSLYIEWDLAGFHGWFLDWVELYAFADGPDGGTQTLVATPHGEGWPGPPLPGETDGPFHFSGNVTLDVTAGYDYGFIVKGENFDLAGALIGTLTLKDTTPPTLDPTATPDVLWPPNHKMREVVVCANAQDDCDESLSLSVIVVSDEPADGTGDGDTDPDVEVVDIDDDTGKIHLNLRAERAGDGDGRVYTIKVTATDDAGNQASKKVQVTVPHDH